MQGACELGWHAHSWRGLGHSHGSTHRAAATVAERSSAAIMQPQAPPSATPSARARDGSHGGRGGQRSPRSAARTVRSRTHPRDRPDPPRASGSARTPTAQRCPARPLRRRPHGHTVSTALFDRATWIWAAAQVRMKTRRRWKTTTWQTTTRPSPTSTLRRGRGGRMAMRMAHRRGSCGDGVNPGQAADTVRRRKPKAAASGWSLGHTRVCPPSTGVPFGSSWRCRRLGDVLPWRLY